MNNPVKIHHVVMLVVIVFMLTVFGVPVSNASEGDISVEINGFSKHNKHSYVWNGKRDHYNERNDGLGLRYGVSDYLDASIGFYDNSFRKNSVYASVNLKYDFRPFGGNDFIIAPGIKAGVVSGYNNTPNDDAAMLPGNLAPIALPNVEVQYDRAGVNIGYLPAISDKKDTSVWMVQFTVRLN